VCNRSGGLIAREIEALGIPTVIIMMYKEMAGVVKPPRTVHVKFPFGRPMGEPNNKLQQKVIAQDALNVLHSCNTPGEIIELPYRWRRENYEEIAKGKMYSL
tara:strand:+ start:504 stop:809 length:306 start_codon:yes stop_codon:yes gene_type:complete